MGGTERLRVAYQGASGAFSEEACLRFVPGFDPMSGGTASRPWTSTW